MADFEFTSHGSVWNIRAVSDAAKEFARENLPVESWMGVPENFTTDHNAARALLIQLADEGWKVRYIGRDA